MSVIAVDIYGMSHLVVNFQKGQLKQEEEISKVTKSHFSVLMYWIPFP